ncbi:MAG: hypothetical protein HW414_1575 [Dehalococcoidia bacterium]|nr:hypothetical protein [Dehalococcoidia bacterium]
MAKRIKTETIRTGIEMKLTEQQKKWEKWASRKRQGASAEELRKLLRTQKGRCAFSDVEMVFEKTEGTPIRSGRGCHPLYPAVDHKDPGNSEGGYRIICYALNDVKGHLSLDCFRALRRTKAWHTLMEQWRQQAAKNKTDRKAFSRLLRPNAKPK